MRMCIYCSGAEVAKVGLKTCTCPNPHFMLGQPETQETEIKIALVFLSFLLGTLIVVKGSCL